MLREYQDFIQAKINSLILSYIKYKSYFQKLDINEEIEFNKICVHECDLFEFVKPILKLAEEMSNYKK